MLNLLESTSLFSVESVHSQWFPKNPSFPRLQIQSYIADHLKLLWQNLLVYYLYFNIYLIFLFSLAMKHFLILLLEYLYLFFFQQPSLSYGHDRTVYQSNNQLPFTVLRCV